MQTHRITLNRLTLEILDVDIEADTPEAAKTLAMKQYDAEVGGGFSLVSSCSTADLGDDEPMNSLRVKMIERLFGTEGYDETEKDMGVRDLLTNIRHYCDAHDINFAHQDSAAYQHYSEEEAEHRRDLWNNDHLVK